MRKYSMGAFLLDLEDPSRVIGRLSEPLLAPNETEREGYVPNVIYSCGGVIHNGELIIPYAMSDYASTFATVSLKRMLSKMQPCQRDGCSARLRCRHKLGILLSKIVRNPRNVLEIERLIG